MADIQGRKLSIVDPTSGDTVRVRWMHNESPTDEDVTGILDAYKARKTPAGQSPGLGYSMSEQQAQVGDEAQQYNREQAQQISQQSRALDTQRHPIREAALRPFGTIAEKLPAALQNKATTAMGGMADALSPIPNLARGFEAAYGVPQAPDAKTGASRAAVALARLGMGAYGAVNPLAVGAFNEGTHILGEVSPTAGKVVHAVSNPVTSIFNPQTEYGKNIAESMDAVAQAAAYEGASKLAGKVKYNMSDEGQIAKGQKEFQQAVAPSTAPSKAKQAIDYPEKVATASRYIADEARARKSATGQIFEKGSEKHIAQQSLELGLDAEKNLYSKMTAPINEFGHLPVNGIEAVNNTLREAIPENVRQLHPEVVDAAMQTLRPYLQDMPLRVMNQEISALNAARRKFYAANPAEQAAMERADPSLPVKLVLAKHLRETMFNKLEENGVRGVDKLRKDYGSLSEVNDLQMQRLQSNLNKDNRSIFSGYGSPFKMGFWAGALGKIAGLSTGAAGVLDAAVTGEQILSKSRSKPSSLLNRATNRFAKSSSLKGGEIERSPRQLPQFSQGGIAQSQQNIAGSPNVGVQQTNPPIGLGSGQKQLKSGLEQPRSPYQSVDEIPSPNVEAPPPYPPTQLGSGQSKLRSGTEQPRSPYRSVEDIPPPQGRNPATGEPFFPTGGIEQTVPDSRTRGGAGPSDLPMSNQSPENTPIQPEAPPPPAPSSGLPNNVKERLRNAGHTEEQINSMSKDDAKKALTSVNPIESQGAMPEGSLGRKVSTTRGDGIMTPHAYRLGRQLNLAEANQAWELHGKKESPYGGSGTQFYKEALDQFIKDRFRKVDTGKGKENNYSPTQIQERLDWLNRVSNNKPKDFPNPILEGGKSKEDLRSGEIDKIASESDVPSEMMRAATAAKSAGHSLKEQKQYIVNELQKAKTLLDRGANEKALNDAGIKTSTVKVKVKRDGKGVKQLRVVTEIPGDGEFHTPTEKIGDYIKKVKARFPEKSIGPTESDPMHRGTPLPAGDLSKKYANEDVQKLPGTDFYHSGGHVLKRGEPAKGMKPPKGPAPEFTKELAQRSIEHYTGKIGEPVTRKGFAYNDKDFGESGVSHNPVGHKEGFAIFTDKAGNNYTYRQANYNLAVKDVENPEFHILDKGELQVVKDGKVEAIVMPYAHKEGSVTSVKHTPAMLSERFPGMDFFSK